MTTGYKVLNEFRKRWQLLQWLEVLLCGLGPALCYYIVFKQVLFAVLIFLVVVVGLLIFKRPWETTVKRVIGFVDRKVMSAQYSSGLLLHPKKDLAPLAQLQQYRITAQLQRQLKSVNPPHHLKRAGLVLGGSLLLGFLLLHFNILDQIGPKKLPNALQNPIVFSPNDSTAIQETQVPKIIEQQLRITYPAYTKKASFQSEKMDVSAVEGSQLTWHIGFDNPVESVLMKYEGKEYPLKWTKKGYAISLPLERPTFYNFRFISVDGSSYSSELYALEALSDTRPHIAVPDLEQFTTYSIEDKKRLAVKTVISDDYGVNSAKIVATVSKGSGEAVKFREEELNFMESFSAGTKKVVLNRTLDLDALKMEPGDELYFYIEATDLRTPKPNRSRSETFFAVIQDTVSDYFEVEGTFGVDQLPDYFRSQRQLIIDTEKLLKERPQLTKEEFKFKSNELGFDQKALRLKYAEFMGEETESGVEHTHEEIETGEEEDHENEDPLAAYTHDHDSENEHNLVPDEEQKKEKDNKDPLAAYVHNHEDPESSTLFTQSLKSKLRQALNEMWDSELHLRLYHPETSLPYQYRALKLIQEIKNSARIYVHRIGFDPPPIKEDKRLSGKIDEVSGFRKDEDIAIAQQYPAMREALQRATVLGQGNIPMTEDDRTVFEKAGNELAILAIENPGKHLKTLQQLKLLTENKGGQVSFFKEVQSGLLKALPEVQANPAKRTSNETQINALVLKELEAHD